MFQGFLARIVATATVALHGRETIRPLKKGKRSKVVKSNNNKTSAAPCIRRSEIRNSCFVRFQWIIPPLLVKFVLVLTSWFAETFFSL